MVVQLNGLGSSFPSLGPSADVGFEGLIKLLLGRVKCMWTRGRDATRPFGDLARITSEGLPGFLEE